MAARIGRMPGIRGPRILRFRLGSSLRRQRAVLRHRTSGQDASGSAGWSRCQARASCWILRPFPPAVPPADRYAQEVGGQRRGRTVHRVGRDPGQVEHGLLAHPRGQGRVRRRARRSSRPVCSSFSVLAGEPGGSRMVLRSSGSRRVIPSRSSHSSSGITTRRVVPSACLASAAVNGWGRPARIRAARSGGVGRQQHVAGQAAQQAGALRRRGALCVEPQLAQPLRAGCAERRVRQVGEHRLDRFGHRAGRRGWRPARRCPGGWALHRRTGRAGRPLLFRFAAARRSAGIRRSPRSAPASPAAGAGRRGPRPGRGRAGPARPGPRPPEGRARAGRAPRARRPPPPGAAAAAASAPGRPASPR